MKERPILCNEDEVRAILDGRQTQVRRVIKSHPLIDCGMSDSYIPDNYVIDDCPFGKIGDRLWVQETFRIIQWVNAFNGCEGDKQIVYKVGNTYGINHWKPSTNMPRWASRITMDVTGVRVERLQSISHNDACVSGAPSEPELNDYGTGSIYIDWFAYSWDLDNSKRGYSWKSNPWVWVIEFRRVMTDRETE